MQPFSWYRATTLQAAVARLGDEPDARFIAGGIGLIPAMKARQVKVATLIDISGLTALREISEVGGRLRIGALTSHQEVARSPLVRARCPALASLAQSIGDPQVRHRGTLGGALATNDPAGDWPTAALGLDAEIETDRRTISAGRFLLGPYATALARDEAIVAVTFRVPKASAYLKVIRKSLRYAFVGVFIARFALQPRGSSSDVRVAVTGGAGGRSVWRLRKRHWRSNSKRMLLPTW